MDFPQYFSALRPLHRSACSLSLVTGWAQNWAQFSGIATIRKEPILFPNAQEHRGRFQEYAGRRGWTIALQGARGELRGGAVRSTREPAGSRPSQGDRRGAGAWTVEAAR